VNIVFLFKIFIILVVLVSTAIGISRQLFFTELTIHRHNAIEHSVTRKSYTDRAGTEISTKSDDVTSLAREVNSIGQFIDPDKLNLQISMQYQEEVNLGDYLDPDNAYILQNNKEEKVINIGEYIDIKNVLIGTNVENKKQVVNIGPYIPVEQYMLINLNLDTKQVELGEYIEVTENLEFE